MTEQLPQSERSEEAGYDSNLTKSITFWENQFHGLEVQEFPVVCQSQGKAQGLSLKQFQTLEEYFPSTEVTQYLSHSDPDLLYAAWALVIGHHSRIQDVVFGTIPRDSILPLQRPLARLVKPMRVSWTTDTTVFSIMRNVHSQLEMIHQHSGIDLDEISELSSDAEDACKLRSIFRIHEGNELPLSDAHVCDNRLFEPLAIILECKIENGCTVLAKYDENLIDKQYMSNLFAQFIHVYHQFSHAVGETAVCDIDPFCSQDLAQVRKWNKDPPPEINQAICDAFDQQYSLHPNSLAVCSWDGELTYRELYDLSSRLAGYLVEMGVQLGTIVPLCFDKSIWAIVSMVAVMRAGGCCVNLSPYHPKDRIQRIIIACESTIVLTTPQHIYLFENIPDNTIVTEAFVKDLPIPNHKKFPIVSPDDTAYILFTSGSTGEPKGIVIEHGSLCTSSEVHGSKWNIGPGTRVFQFAAYTFDVSVADIFFSIMRGACVCMPSEEDRMNDPAGAARSMGVTWANLTPSVANLMLPEMIPSLKMLVLGGEATSRKNLDDWAEHVDLIVITGPAETTIHLMASEPASKSSDPSNVGIALSGRIWIVDPSNHERLAPIGAIGELLIEGRIVAREYFKDAKKTAVAFIQEASWLPQAGKQRSKSRRIFKSGDLVRYNSDGTVSFIGRKDNQVKIRGQRVELGEIEYQILKSMPGIDRVVPYLSNPSDQGGRFTLIAFLVFKGRFEASGEHPNGCQTLDAVTLGELKALKSALVASLPSYMVPSLYVPLGRIPLTLNGKNDARKLRKIFQSLSTEQLKLMSLSQDVQLEPIEQQQQEQQQEYPPWENESTPSGSVKESAEAFWSNYLEGSKPMTTILDVNRNGKERLEQRLLLDLTSSYSTEIYYAAWAILLWRYADSATEVIFGIVTNSQDKSADPLPLRLPLSSTLIVKSFIHAIQTSVASINSYPICEIEKIKALSADAVSACLFRTVVEMCSTLEDIDTTDSTIRATRNSAQHNIELRLNRSNKNGYTSVVAEANYDGNVVASQQIHNILEQFRLIARQLGSMSADATLQDIEFIGPYDLAQIMYWNGTLPLCLDDNVPAIFVKQALSTPFAPAICSKDRDLTYEQLYFYAKRLAHFLINRGLSQESIVPLCFDKSPWAIVSMMAVLMAGGTISMLSPSFPNHRINMILSKCHATLILSDPQYSKLFEDAGSDTIVIDECFIKHLPDFEQTNLATIPSKQAAYVVFTSGTTGNPKAIVVEHGSLCTSSEATGIRFGIGPGTRVLQFSAYTFDASIGDILFSLMRGACVCSPSEQERLEDLPMAVSRMQANWVFLTPSVVNTLHPSSFPSLKRLLIGGERVTRKNLSEWATSVSMHLMMGPSECTVYCMGTDAVGPMDDPSGIGYAMSNRLWVVDPSDVCKLSPIGCVGELIIEGRQVARGYLGMKDLTAQTFCEGKPWSPPYKGLSSQRFYHSGDLVRLNWDGSMSFVGRKSSEQVKIRGQRVELVEIENAIKQTVPGLRDAIVMVNKVERYKGRHSLVAFLVHGDEPAATDDLKLLQTTLFSILPSYMVPTLFVPLEQVPINLSGKTDQAQLRQILEDLTQDEIEIFSFSSKPDQAPTSPKGHKLRELWTSALGIGESEIGISSHFVRLGGDSLQAMGLVTLASAAGYRLQFTDIMNRPIFQEMLEYMFPAVIEELELDIEPFELLGSDCSILAMKDSIASYCQIASDSIEDIYPCSPLQEGLISLTSRNSISYVMRNVYQLSSDVDIHKFRSVWEQVVASIDILRTRIALYDWSRPLQVVVKEHVSWHIESTLESYAKWDSTQPMESGKALARFGLVRLGETWHFILTCHHALYDGFSLPLLLDRVNDVYCGRHLAPFTPFKRYIKYLYGTSVDEMSSFWKARLDEAPQSSWPPISGYIDEVEFLTRSIDISPISNSEFTISTLIQASFAVLLAAYNDSKDVTFALTVAGRNHPVSGILEMLGPTISTIPFRTIIEKDSTVKQLCSVIHKSTLGSLPYEHLGVQNIRRLSPDVEQACNMRSHLVIQPLEKTKTEGLFSLENPSIDLTNTYSLSLECRLTRTGIVLAAEYDPKVLSAKQVNRFQLQFTHILNQMTRSYESRVDSLNFVTCDDLEEISKLNHNSLDTVQSCIHQMVSDKAQLYPDQFAIESWDGNITYSQLDDLSTRLAIRLCELGLNPNDMVPICSEKSAWVVVAMLAVLRAGGAFVPLDPSNPFDRLRGIVNQVKAKIIVVSPTLRPLWMNAVSNVVELSSNISKLPNLKQSLLPKQVNPSSLAYIIFTSGSTGIPKGVELEHGAYLSAALSRMDLIHRDHNTRVLQFNSYSFDACVEDIFTTLIAGGTICIATSSEIRNDLVGAMNRFRVNCIDLTPSVANLLTPGDVPSLEVLIIGGEALSAAYVQRWASHVKLVFTYGPSECAIVSTTTRGLTPASDATDIGVATCGRTWIVDSRDHHRLMLYGAVGELLMEGPLLAKGYINNKEKTDEVFVRNLAWAPPGSRFYKTGDLVRYLDNGNLQFIGRKDSQIKIRGQRVEIAEVEGSLKLCSEASDIAVEFLRLPNNKQVLVAFFCFPPSSGIDATISETERKIAYRATESQMRRIIPIYMVPTVFITLGEMPVTVSGKLNRSRLRSMVLEMPESKLNDYRLEDSLSTQPPSTDQQKLLQELWSSSLGISCESIGIGSNFFSLGGDSIDAMRLAGAAKRSGLRLTVFDIFRHPLLADMATLLTTLDNGQGSQSYEDPAAFSLLPVTQTIGEILRRAEIDLHEDEVEDMYPCTPLQEGLMAISSRQPQAYVVQQVYKLSVDINVDRFRDAWISAIKANPILRTRIAYIRGLGSMQIVLREPDEWASSNNLSKYLQCDRTVDMCYNTPLSRFCLVHGTDDREVYFVYTAHHSTFDGYSSSILSQNVTRIYHDSENRLSKAPSFNRFVSYLQGINVSDSHSYWKRQLTGSPSTTIFARQHSHSESRHESVALGGIAIEKTKRLSGLLSTATTATIIRAAWALVMGQLAESNDVLFGATLSGRDVPVAGVEDICAPTITTIPVRIRIDRSQAIQEFIEQLQQQAFDTAPHQHYGLQNMRLLNRKVLDLSTILVIHPEEEQETTLCEEIMQPYIVEGTDSIVAGEQGYHKQPLVLIGYLKADEVGLKAVYNDLIISRIQVERILSTLQHVIKELCYETQNIHLGDIVWCSNEASQQILNWNKRSPDPEASTSNVLELLRMQSYLRADSAAIHSWDAELTFAELDFQSSALASYLGTLDIQRPSDLTIPVIFDKSAFMVVAMISVLKLGAAYTLLDPNHRTLRLRRTIHGLNTEVLLVSPEHHYRVKVDVKHAINVDIKFLNKLTHDVSLTGVVFKHDSTAAIIFESESKSAKDIGVAISHSSLCQLTEIFAPHLRISHGDRVLQFSPIDSGAATCEIIVTLARGACICIPPNSHQAKDVVDTISEMKISWIYISKSMDMPLKYLRELSSLKTVMINVEDQASTSHLTIDQEDAALKIRYPFTLIRNFGVTEACAWSSFELVDNSSSPYNIKPANGCGIWLVDPDNHHNLTPPGIVGELLLEGPLLSSSYLHDNDRTSRMFVYNPTWAAVSDSNRRFFKTGRLARHNDATGSLSLFGRKDRMTNLGGQRIDLDMIEKYIRHACNSLNTAVQVIHIENDEKRLVALICNGVTDNRSSRGDATSSLDVSEDMVRNIEALEALLSQTFPAYMVPSMIIPMTALPGIGSEENIKILVRSYAFEWMRHQSEKTTAKPVPSDDSKSTSINLLKDLWAEVLGLPADSISSSDSFFGLGGDSISAIRLSMAATSFSMETRLTVADIFRTPLLCDMAGSFKSSLLALSDTPDDVANFSLIKRFGAKTPILKMLQSDWGFPESAIEDVLPCTPLQETLMALSTQHTGAYATHFVYRLPENLNIDKFVQAWQATVDTFEILRTRIVPSDGRGSLQVIVLDDNTLWHNCKSLSDLFSLKTAPNCYGKALASFHLVGLDNPATDNKFVMYLNHAIYDAWSLSLILQHVEDIYFARPTVSPKPFKLFVEYLVQGDTQSHDRFWSEELKNLHAIDFPQLPNPLPQKPLRSSTQPLKFTLDNKTDFTLSTIIQAAWALVVAVNSHSDDVVFGLTLSGRDTPVQGINLIGGPTLMTVPRRVQINRNATVGDLLKSMQDGNSLLLAHGHTGMQAIKRLPGLQRVGFQNLLVTHVQNEEWSSTLFEKDETPGANDFHTLPLLVSCTSRRRLNDLQSRIEIEATFDQSIISRKKVERLLSQLVSVSQQFCHTSQVLRDIDACTSEDRAQIEVWNSREPVLANRTIHNTVCDHAQLFPLTPAICSWDGDLSYQQLEKISNQVASYIRSSFKICHDNVVLICLQRSKWVPVTLYGVLKAGCAYGLLDRKEETQKLLMKLRDTGAVAVVVDSTTQTIFEDHNSHTTMIKFDWQQLETTDINTKTTLENWKHSTPREPAIITFSQSPILNSKANVLDHRSICSWYEANYSNLHLSASTRTLHITSYVSDISNLEILATLMAGGCVCIVPDIDNVTHVDVLADAIQKLNVSHLFQTPTIIRSFGHTDGLSVDHLILHSEPVSEDIINLWADRMQISAIYTPATCAFATLCTQIGFNSIPNNFTRTPGTSLWIINPNNVAKLTSIGAIGELWVEENLISSSYIGIDESTDMIQLCDREWVSRVQGEKVCKLYRTGELAKFEDDGTITILAQNELCTFQGYSIDLDTTRLEQHIRRALADADNLQLLVDIVNLEDSVEQNVVGFLSLNSLPTYIQSLEQEEDDSSAAVWFQENFSKVQQHLSLNFPPFMLPAYFIFLKAMPVTLSNTIDREKIHRFANNIKPATLHFSANSEATGKAPTSSMEICMRAMWCRVLGVEESSVGIDDAFIPLGGDSISAMRLVALARSNKIKLSVAEILHAENTLQKLSAKAKLVSSGPVASIAGTNQVSRKKRVFADEKLRESITTQISPNLGDLVDISPATDYQTSMVTSGMLASRGWSNYVILEFPETVAPRALEYACKVLINHHPILRTAFFAHQSQLWQAVYSSIFIALQHFSSISDAALQCNNWIRKDKSLSSTLNRRELRGATFETLNDGSMLVLGLSHAMWDGISLPIIVNDIYSLLNAESLEPRPSFADFACFVREQDNSQGKRFWKDLLEGASMTNVIEPTGFSYRAPLDTTVSRLIPTPDLAAHGFTFATILKTAWALVLSAWSGNTDVCFGHLVSGRSSSFDGVDQLVGPCINMLPVRLDVSQGTNLALLQQTQNQYVATLPYECLGFQEIIRDCTNWPRWQRFSSVVQYQNLKSALMKPEEARLNYRLVCPPADSADVLVIAAPHSLETEVTVTVSDTLWEHSVPSILVNTLCQVINELATGLQNEVIINRSRLAGLPSLPVLKDSFDPSRSCLSMDRDEEGEEVITKIWEELGYKPKIDVDEPFYMQTGTISTAMQFVDVFQRELGIEVTIEELVDMSTVKLQALLWRRKKEEEAGGEEFL